MTSTEVTSPRLNLSTLSPRPTTSTITIVVPFIIWMSGTETKWYAHTPSTLVANWQTAIGSTLTR